jgi:hypothetical protein
MLMREDLERAYKIYGLHPEYIRGKLTKKTVGRILVDPTLRSVSKTLKIYVDVMHVDTKKFLVSVADPLNLTMQSLVHSESRQDLGMALQGQMVVLRNRGYVPTIVYSDPQSAFRSMTQDFPGVEIDVGGAGDYVAKVDARIRRIKETYRTVKNGLAWSLPRSLVPDLVAYVVSRLNIRRTTALSENVCPRVLFTGMPVNYAKELGLAFGDYVESYEGTTNTSKARSSACIALYPTANATGAWVLWKIKSRTRVRRTNYVKLVTNELIIDAINQIALDEDISAALPSAGISEIPEETEKKIQGDIPQETQTGAQDDTQEEPQPDSHQESQQDPRQETQQLAEGEPQNNDAVAEDEMTGEMEEDETIRTRSGRVITRPSRFLAVTKVAHDEWKLVENAKAIKTELKLLFKDLRAL